MLNLDEILRYAVTREASDVHIKVGSAPVVRIDGHLERSDFELATPAETERVAFAIMPKNRAEEFIETGEADFAHSVAGLGRFRVNVHRQRGCVGLILRRVQGSIPSFDSLGLPPSVRRLAGARPGSCSSPARPVRERRRRSPRWSTTSTRR